MTNMAPLIMQFNHSRFVIYKFQLNINYSDFYMYISIIIQQAYNKYFMIVSVSFYLNYTK